MAISLESTPGTVKSADRVLTLFELLGTWGKEMSHTEIAEALGIPKSSLTQLLRNMTGRGWLAYSPVTKGYSLGNAFAKLARRAGQSLDLVNLAGPVLAQLTAQTSESSAMNILRGDFAEVVATVVGPQRLVSHMRLGDAAPLYATSGAKVILAFLPINLQDEYLSRANFEKATPKTIETADELRERLKVIRRDGIAYSFDEWTPGVTGMARPVLSPEGDVLASLNVAMPTLHYDEAKHKLVAAALQQAVDTLQSQLANR